MCYTGVPSCPVGPLQVTDVRKSSAVLHWQPPTDDGGRPLVYAHSFLISLLKHFVLGNLKMCNVDYQISKRFSFICDLSNNAITDGVNWFKQLKSNGK